MVSTLLKGVFRFLNSEFSREIIKNITSKRQLVNRIENETTFTEMSGNKNLL